MNIREFFEQNNRVAVAFSGGVDSSYLLYEAKAAGAHVTAYYVKSQFQPEFELEDAAEIASIVGADMKVIGFDALADETVRRNPADRCYYCKIGIMGTIIKAAAADGFEILCDGTNASDDVDDRPGFRALGELGIRSPLRECGLTKQQIRLNAKAAGLPVWDKPAYACLATRIPSGEEITEDKLVRTEAAEAAMFSMGFRDFRVRMRGDAALIQVRADQHNEAELRLNEITEKIGGMYSSVTLDDKVR